MGPAWSASSGRVAVLAATFVAAAPESQQPEISAISPGWNDAESQFEITCVVSFAAPLAGEAAGFTLETIVFVDDREGEPVAGLGPVVSAVRRDDGVRTDRGMLLDPVVISRESGAAWFRRGATVSSTAL